MVADAVVGQPVEDVFFDSSDPRLVNMNNGVVFLLRPGCEKCETLVQSEPFQRFIGDVPADRVVSQVSIESDYLWTYELNSRAQGEISWHSRPGWFTPTPVAIVIDQSVVTRIVPAEVLLQEMQHDL